MKLASRDSGKLVNHENAERPGALFPPNTYEIFAYCDEARCYALGAQANVGGVFSSGGQLNLDAAYGFGNLHKGHSAQFNSDMNIAWFKTTARSNLSIPA